MGRCKSPRVGTRWKAGKEAVPNDRGLGSGGLGGAGRRARVGGGFGWGVGVIIRVWEHPLSAPFPSIPLPWGPTPASQGWEARCPTGPRPALQNHPSSGSWRPGQASLAWLGLAWLLRGNELGFPPALDPSAWGAFQPATPWNCISSRPWCVGRGIAQSKQSMLHPALWSPGWLGIPETPYHSLPSLFDSLGAWYPAHRWPECPFFQLAAHHGSLAAQHPGPGPPLP